MTDELKPSDHLYYSIKALTGWYEALANAEDSYAQALRRDVGTLISSVLLAAGDDAEVIAVSGKLENALTGKLVAVFPNVIVTVNAKTLGGDQGGSHEARVHQLADAKNLVVEARHSYYAGTDTHPRFRNFAFSFELDGQRHRLEPSNNYSSTPQVKDAAIYAAFVAIRDHAAGIA
jgi:hypothetical protein